MGIWTYPQPESEIIRRGRSTLQDPFWHSPHPSTSLLFSLCISVCARVWVCEWVCVCTEHTFCPSLRDSGKPVETCTRTPGSCCLYNRAGRTRTRARGEATPWNPARGSRSACALNRAVTHARAHTWHKQLKDFKRFISKWNDAPRSWSRNSRNDFLL